MALPHLDRPICEPVELPPGAPLRIERIRQGGNAARSEPFVHFHDVHELVLFGRVAGHFDVEDRRYALAPGCIAFVPSMRQHDFSLEAGPRDWVLLQVEAAAGESLSRLSGLERLREPFCARPGRHLGRRLRQLTDWLVELEPRDPLALPLVAPRHLESCMGRVVVDVMLKPEILDPQGQAVAGALPRLGFTGFTSVRQGKRFELEVDGDVTDEVLAQAREAAATLLSNPVIEDVVRVERA